MIKKKWETNFHLLKLYTGERWFKFIPAAISLEQNSRKST